MIETIIDFILRVAGLTLIELLMVLGPLFLIGFSMNALSRFIERHAVNLMGTKAYLVLFGWLGVTIHELGHAMFCPVFKHKIVKMDLFRPDFENGTLGSVQHAYDRRSWYQRAGNFFIGIGPVILGSALLVAFAWLLLGHRVFGVLARLSGGGADILSFSGVGRLLDGFLSMTLSWIEMLIDTSAWKHWQFYLFLYLSFAIGSAINLSTADLEGAWNGFVTLLLTVLIINAVIILLGLNYTSALDSISRSLTPVFGLLALALLLNIMAGTIVLALAWSVQKIRGK